MLKYRGTHLIRAGFIGVVLIMLVIAVGLQPERLRAVGDGAPLPGAVRRGRRHRRRQRRDGVRHQGRLGVVGQTRQRRRAGRLHHRRQVRARVGHHARTSAPEPCSASGCWRWTRRAAARSIAQHVIPTTRTSSPYSLTDAVSDLTANTAGTDTEIAQPVAGHAVGRRSTRSLRSWVRPSTACRGCRSR